MDNFHDNPIQLMQLQGARTILRQFQQEEKDELNKSEREVIEATKFLLQRKAGNFKQAKTVMKHRSPDYSPKNVIVDRAPDVLALQNALEDREISVKNIENAVTNLEVLINNKRLAYDKLTRTLNLLNRLEDFIMSEE